MILSHEHELDDKNHKNAQIKWPAVVSKKQGNPIISFGSFIRQASSMTSLRWRKKSANVRLNKAQNRPVVQLWRDYPLIVDPSSRQNVTPQLLGQMHMVLTRDRTDMSELDYEYLLHFVVSLLSNRALPIRTRKALGESLRCHDPKAYSGHVPDEVRDFQFPSVLGALKNRHSEHEPVHQYGQENEVNVPVGGASLVKVAHHLGLNVKRYHTSHQRESYETFKIEPDNSIKTPFMSGLMGEEIVSPILESAQQISQVQMLGQVMGDIGYRKHASCGDHVHVGLASIKPKAVGLAEMDYATFQVRLAGQLAIVFAHAYDFLDTVCIGNDYNAPNWNNGRSSSLSKECFIKEIVKVGEGPVNTAVDLDADSAHHFMRPLIDVVNPKITDIDPRFRHRARNHQWGKNVDYRTDPINDRWLAFNLWSYLSIGTAELRCLTLKGHHYHSAGACTQVLQIELAHQFTELALQMLRANKGSIDPAYPASIERLVYNFRKKITTELLVMGLTQWDQRRGIQQLTDVIELHGTVLNYSMIKRALSQVPPQSLARFSVVDKAIKGAYIDVITQAPNYYDEFALSALHRQLLIKQHSVGGQMLEWVRSNIFSNVIARNSGNDMIPSGDEVA